jgi:hypothetical protein
MASTLHKIRASLHDNQLTQDNPYDFIARVIAERSLGVSEICTSAALRGGSDIPAAAMEHATNLFLKEMAYLMCDGFSVNTGWFTASAHIRGVFDSPGETFNPDKHTVLFEFHQGSMLRQELEQVTVEILGVADTGAVIMQVLDVRTGSINDLLTPLRNLKITGHKIKVAGDEPTVGVYFINTVTTERTPVEAEDIVTNNPSEVIVVTPALAAGTYQVEIVTQFTAGILLKEPRSTTFDKILTVQ